MSVSRLCLSSPSGSRRSQFDSTCSLSCFLSRRLRLSMLLHVDGNHRV